MQWQRALEIKLACKRLHHPFAECESEEHEGEAVLTAARQLCPWRPARVCDERGADQDDHQQHEQMRWAIGVEGSG